MNGSLRTTAICAWYALALALSTGPAAPACAQSPAQGPPPFAPWGEVHAGSEVETYLRTLQTLGLAGEHAWSLRGFSAPEMERIALGEGTTHPWSGLFELEMDSAARDGVLPARPRFSSIANTSFTYGVNDGALWAGRGTTLAVEGGIRYRNGPFTLSLQPILFRSQNAVFAEIPPLIYIDAPDRPGAGPHARLDLGETYARLDFPWLSAGLSTARMVWGPAERYPLVLGTNAPGFAHLFLGSGDPANLGFGHLRFRLVWGRLEQSGLVPAADLSGPRFASSAIAVLEPKWPRGLELGIARFYHLPWRSSGPTVHDVLRPFEGFTEARVGPDNPVTPADAENQVASVFARWVFPGTGLEFFGEFYREDRSLDVRDLLVEPDHDLATNLGVRKAWWGPNGDVSVLSIELLDAKINHLEAVRPQTLPYPHNPLLQGHTHRGQFLGSPAAFGGEGLAVAVDRYSPQGRRTVRFERTLRRDARKPYVDGEEPARDVAYALTAEVLSFRRAWEVLGEATGVWNLNRNLGGDRGNVRLAVSARWRPGNASAGRR